MTDYNDDYEGDEYDDDMESISDFLKAEEGNCAEVQQSIDVLGKEYRISYFAYYSFNYIDDFIFHVMN